jgi:hypothetical protein
MRPSRLRQAEMLKVLQQYLEGLRHCDGHRLRHVFHPKALYATGIGRHLRLLSIEEYLALVEARSPVTGGLSAMRGEIVSIDFTSPETASARVQVGMASNSLINLLTLSFVDGRWQAIAEIFGWETSTSLAGAV